MKEFSKSTFLNDFVVPIFLNSRFFKIMNIIQGPQSQNLISVQFFSKGVQGGFFRKLSNRTLYVY